MGPPSFSDLGKSAKDLFSKNFTFGVVKIEHKTSASEGISLTTSGTHSFSSGVLDGSLKAEYKLPEYGAKFAQKWDTKNDLSSEISVEDKLVNGLKNTLEFTFNPNDGRKDTKFKTSFKQSFLNSSLDFDLMKPNNLVNGSIAISCPNKDWDKFVLGTNFSFDNEKRSIGKMTFAASFIDKDFVLFTSLCGDNVNTSVYYTPRCCLQTAINVNAKLKEGRSVIGFASQYKVDKDSFVKAKIDTSAIVGVAYCRTVLSGVKLTLSGQFNATRPNDGDHKLGLTLEFDK